MNVIEQTLSTLDLGEPVAHANLAMYPMSHSGVAEPGYLLLDEALQQDLVTITEVDESGHVPQLKLENRAEKPVLLLDGEELVGAKQNRVVNLTLLVAARSILVIPVSCVEAGRWSWREQRFTTSGRAHFARGRARRVASVSACMAAEGSRRSNQGEVWACIDEKLDALGVESDTRAMEDAFRQRSETLEEYTKPFTVRPGQTGALFAIDGQISGLDLFDCPATLGKLLPKLVRSHALDALESRLTDKAKSSGQKAEPLGFLARLRQSRSQAMPAIGLGEDVRLTGEAIAGAALVHEQRVVHLCAFPLETTGHGSRARHTRLRRASERFRVI